MNHLAMLEQLPPRDADPLHLDVLRLRVALAWHHASGGPFVPHAPPQPALLVAIALVDVHARDFRGDAESRDQLANVTIEVGGREKARGRVADRSKHRIPTPQRRLEPAQARGIGRVLRSSEHLGGVRQ